MQPRQTWRLIRLTLFGFIFLFGGSLEYPLIRKGHPFSYSLLTPLDYIRAVVGYVFFQGVLLGTLYWYVWRPARRRPSE